jgi:hypothetical protein
MPIEIAVTGAILWEWKARAGRGSRRFEAAKIGIRETKCMEAFSATQTTVRPNQELDTRKFQWTRGAHFNGR